MFSSIFHVIVHHPKFPIISTLVMALLLSISTYLAYGNALNSFNERVYLSEQNALHSITLKLETTLEKPTYITYGLAATISDDQHISDASFNYVAQQLLAEHEFVKNYSLSKGYKLIKVYPKKGNEAAIGLKFDEASDTSYQHAINTKQTVFEWPVNLIQSGLGIIIRTPIFDRDDNFWGQISAVIDLEALFKHATITHYLQDHDLAIIKTDSQGKYLSTVYGDHKSISGENIVRDTFNVANSYWQLYATPKYQKHWLYQYHILLLIELFDVLFCYLLFLYLSQIKNLQEKKKLAEVLGETRRQLLLTATHDLRQPVSALGIAVDLLIHNPNDRVKYQAKACLDSVNHFFDELQDFERLESNNTRVNMQVIEVDELLLTVEAQLRLFTDTKGISLNLNHKDFGLCIESDKLLLQRILRNVLVNAVEHTIDGGIQIKTEKSQQQNISYLNIKISDSGCGIPKHELKNITKPFYRLSDKKQGISTGLGVGLDIVYRLSKLLNIKLDISSQVDIGTIVELKIPLSNKPCSAKPDQGSSYCTLKGSTMMQIGSDSIPEAIRKLFDSWSVELIPPNSVDFECFNFESKKVENIDIENVDIVFFVQSKQQIFCKSDFVTDKSIIVFTNESGFENRREGNVWYITADISPVQLRTMLTKILQ